MTADRNSDGYEPRFDVDYEYGKQGELFVSKIMDSLGTDRIEVKRDARYADTGNVYVEFSCLRRGKWRPSGIATTEAEFWVFVLSDSACVAVTTAYLLDASRAAWKNNPKRRKEQQRGSHPTKGVVLEVAWLLQNGARIENAHEGETA